MEGQPSHFDPGVNSHPPEVARHPNVRWTICALLFYARTINYKAFGSHRRKSRTQGNRKRNVEHRRLSRVPKKQIPAISVAMVDPRDAALPPRSSSFRWTICGLLFFATTINYMDRQVLGLLAPDLQKEIGWNEAQYAHIVTAFQAAYAIGLLVFGRLIDALGTKRGYSFSVAFWSLSAAAHALARSVFGFGTARFALGLGEAGNFPAAVKAVAEWFPKRERALANGIFNSGANVGAVLAPLAVP
jgi:Major Facilitator Superfamily